MGVCKPAGRPCLPSSLCSWPGLEALSPRPTLGLSNSEFARKLRVPSRSAPGGLGFKSVTRDVRSERGGDDSEI